MDTEQDLKFEAPFGSGSGPRQNRDSKRGSLYGRILATLVAAVIFIVSSRSLWSSWGCSPKWQLSIEQRAHRILSENPLIDGHNDLLALVRYFYKNRIYQTNFTHAFENGGFPLHVDLPRMDKGKYGGAFWSAFLPCPSNWTDFSDENYLPYVRATLDQIDLYHRLKGSYPHYFHHSGRGREAEQAFASGHLVSSIGIEGLHQIGNSVSNLRLYHRLGVRYATLTWNCHNIYADAAVTPNDSGTTVKATPLWHGVSDAGRDLVTEMNRLGMMVDLSHVSADTMRDVLGGRPERHHGWMGSVSPPIFSHSSAYALCPHPRNVPDDVLHLVKMRKALVMVNFSPDFVSCVANDDNDSETGLPQFYPANNTLHQVVRHIMYIGDLIGYDHVGIGSDYDGMASTPVGLEDVSKFPDLVVEMLRQGISDEDAAKVVGRNLLRVWKEVDDVAERMRLFEFPAEDHIDGPIPEYDLAVGGL